MRKLFIFIGIALIVLVGIFLVLGKSVNGKSIENNLQDNLASMTLKVDIPCSGHASLIDGYLVDAGVSDVQFRNPDYFDITYDSSKISKEQILGIGIFKEYPAREVKN